MTVDAGWVEAQVELAAPVGWLERARVGSGNASLGSNVLELIMSHGNALYYIGISSWSHGNELY
jgi:hypothetical protein